MTNEDITFCANKNCSYLECIRNPKNIKLPIPHSFAMFTECSKWNDNGAKWLFENTENNKD